MDPQQEPPEVQAAATPSVPTPTVTSPTMTSQIPPRRVRKGFIIAAGIFGIMVLCLVSYSIFILHVLSGGGSHSNSAEDALKPLLTRLEQHGAHKVCSGGAGVGGDNGQAWYEGYYQIPNNNNLADQIISIAAEDGYSLRVRGNNSSNSAGTSSKTIEMSGNKGSTNFTIDIKRQGSASVDCYGDKTGKKQPAGANDVDLEIHTIIP